MRKFRVFYNGKKWTLQELVKDYLYGKERLLWTLVEYYDSADEAWQAAQWIANGPVERDFKSL